MCNLFGSHLCSRQRELVLNQEGKQFTPHSQTILHLMRKKEDSRVGVGKGWGLEKDGGGSKWEKEGIRKREGL